MRGKVFTLASVALLSCRAVLGIEDIDDTKTDAGPADGGPTGSDANTTGDAIADARADTNGGKTDVSACTSQALDGCKQCCRSTYKDSAKEIGDVAKTTGCICGAGQCGTECAPSLCGGGAMPDNSCIACIDDALRKQETAECRTAVQNCSKARTCEPFGTCVTGCK